MDIDTLAGKLPLTKSRVQFLDNVCACAPHGDFVECGVYKGWSAAVLINAAGTDRKIYLCDSFAGFPDATGESECIKKIVRQAKAELFNEETVREFLTGLDINISGVQFVKGFFANTLPELTKQSPKIAVLHFDGDFYTSAVDVFKNLLPFVVKGGFVVIHDYPGFAGVKRACDEFFGEGKVKVLSDEIAYVEIV